MELQVTVPPSANTDGSRPANVASIDVYAVTLPAIVGAPPLTDAQWLKVAKKVGSIAVKAPKDPDDTSDPDDPDVVPEEPEGAGLDQGAVAHASETSSAGDADAGRTAEELREKRAKPKGEQGTGPLVGAPVSAPLRTYAAVGVTTRGKKGPLSKRVTVPLFPPPPPPASSLKFTYDETR